MILTVTMNPALDRIYVVDDFSPDNIFRIENMEINAAGKGVNAARVLKILGKEVKAAGILGGSTGKYIQNELKADGIISDFVEIKENIRTNIKVVDNKQDTTTELLEPGPDLSAAEKEKFLNRFKKLAAASEIIAACGSLPPGVGDDFYKKLIEVSREEETKFILDTSGLSLKKAVKAAPFMIKPNEDEIKNLMGKDYSEIKEYIEPLKFLRKQGVKLPVITLGKRGCLALIEEEAIYFPGLSLEVKNVVGSGDAFIAGCAAALSENRDFKEVIKMGMACASANTQFYKTGMIAQDLVEKYLKQIQSKIITK